MKLYYTGKSNIYTNSKLEDSFLQALAEGGFQVGELAKLYYPSGHTIQSLDNEAALKATCDHLLNENVTIFEAAVLYEKLFIRVDILEKRGNDLNLIEVKAKSTDFHSSDSFFNNKKTALKTGWKEYLYDVVFQKYVLQKAYPQFNVSAFLMLADKTKQATVDGLNQRFFLSKENGRSNVVVTDLADTGDKILTLVNVDKVSDFIYSTSEEIENKNLTFENYVHYLANAYSDDRKINASPGIHCASCEFNTTFDDEKLGKKSGFKECWSQRFQLKEEDFKKQFIFELWNFKKKKELLDNGTYFIEDIDESTLDIQKDGNGSGLSETGRQLLQIQKVKNHDSTPYFDKNGLKKEMLTWKYPFHMIDFETTMVAIPFHKGRRPYEAIAFQFSHHSINQDGSYAHKGQYLNTEQGKFPNYDFVRALKKELENDDGSIFRYASHENSYLIAIHNQISNDPEDIPDRENLLKFIESITHSNDRSKKEWQGNRDMIDLLDVVRKFYYHPLMKGSNSIKAVLPAIMESEFIQKKYSEPIYGATTGIKSLNFENFTWIQKDNKGRTISPYKLLPPLFGGIEMDLKDSFISNDSLADGGSAMIAYSKMQFMKMSELERNCIREGLLRYCELDTLAMVMLVEYFRSII